MQAKRHQERVQHRDQQGEDERRIAVHPGQAGADPRAEQVAERADEKRGHRDHDQHGQKRHEDHVHRGRDDLLQAFVEQCGDRGHDQRHEHVAVVAVEDHGQAEHVNDVGRRTEEINNPRVGVLL